MVIELVWVSALAFAFLVLLLAIRDNLRNLLLALVLLVLLSYFPLVHLLGVHLSYLLELPFLKMETFQVLLEAFQQGMGFLKQAFQRKVLLMAFHLQLLEG